jgi:purine-binding chemotaxis protein CheW
MSSEEASPVPPAAAETTLPARDSLLAFVDAILARPAAPTVAPEAEVRPFVCFFLGQAEFGLPILRCREIVRVREITRLPETPPHVRGVLNLRGRVLPVIEMRLCLGLPVAPLTARSRVIMVEAQGRIFGLLVDRVSRILKISSLAMQAAPAEILSAHADKVTAVAYLGSESIVLLDVDELLLLQPTEPTSAGLSG